MTKEDFKIYKKLPSRRDYTIKRINRLERDMSKIPIVKDKVQSSQKEYPYIETHLVVDAPEPVLYSKYKRELIRARKDLNEIENLLDELAAIINKVGDGRTKEILMMRLVYGEDFDTIMAKVNLTERHIRRIIDEAIKKL